MNRSDINRLNKKFKDLKSQILLRKVKSQSENVDFDLQSKLYKIRESKGVRKLRKLYIYKLERKWNLLI